jgi:hypothetical protein
MRALAEYLLRPDGANRRLVCAKAESADEGVGGYWSDHGPLLADLETRLERLVAGHPDEWLLLISSLTGVPEDLATQLRELAPSSLVPLTPAQRAFYNKMVRHRAKRRGPGLSFDRQIWDH